MVNKSKRPSHRIYPEFAEKQPQDSLLLVSGKWVYGEPFLRCKSLMDAVLLARQRGSCYICFSATADRSGLTSRSDHKKKKGENLT